MQEKQFGVYVKKETDKVEKENAAIKASRSHSSKFITENNLPETHSIRVILEKPRAPTHEGKRNSKQSVNSNLIKRISPVPIPVR